MPEAKKVLVLLPAVAKAATIAIRYELELEALEPIGAELVPMDAWDEDRFVEQAQDVDGVLTSWGIPLQRRAIEALQRCVVIGVGSIGTDMIDVNAATEAGWMSSTTRTPGICASANGHPIPRGTTNRPSSRFIDPDGSCIAGGVYRSSAT